jgi:hypothetical protein
MGKVFTPIDTFHTEHDGAPVTLVANVTRVREGHALHRANAGRFKEVDQTVDFDVERVAARIAKPQGR